MNYSYAKGMDRTIQELEEYGFEVEKDGENYLVSFDGSLRKQWENYVAEKIRKDEWNEYVNGEEIVFLFRTEEGIKKYIVKNGENEEVLRMCEKMSNHRYDSLFSMLLANPFYRLILEK